MKTFINNVRVFVDFAHTPDAFKSFTRIKMGGDISLVFGCGGDETLRRSLMAKL